MQGPSADVITSAQEHVKREKQIMAECDCPFMVNLVTSFKDAAHLYMLMECVMGGELFTYLQSRPGPLKEDHARFYAASVVLGLEYMQERNPALEARLFGTPPDTLPLTQTRALLLRHAPNIMLCQENLRLLGDRAKDPRMLRGWSWGSVGLLVCRDLKPENLLIDVTGYVKMADFGFAKKPACRPEDQHAVRDARVPGPRAGHAVWPHKSRRLVRPSWAEGGQRIQRMV